MCKCVSGENRFAFYLVVCVCILLFYDHTVGKEGFLIIDIRVLI